jgi:uncharacterized oligopeptide transporter (OPT) family protein
VSPVVTLFILILIMSTVLTLFDAVFSIRQRANREIHDLPFIQSILFLRTIGINHKAV